MHTPDEPLANLLFEFRGADIILRSHDNQHFRVPKCYIVNSSPVLDELIQDALDAPEDAHGEAQLPVVQLPASGEILRNLLTFIFPVTSVLPSSAEEIMELLSVANKYQMVSVMDHIRNKATTENKLFPRRETTLVVFSLARTYRLPFEALRAAEDSVNYPMAIEDLEDELAIIPGASLYDLWKYHEKFRAILASDLETFRKSGARGTLTGLQCTESSSSHIPRWVDTYIKSTRKSPRLISFVEFTIALVRHIGDGARGNGCACASITTQTILNFWKTLTSVYQKSLRKAPLVLYLWQEREDSQPRVNSTTSLPEPLDIHDPDLIIRSSDHVNFRVHKSLLAMVSPFFRDRLSLLQLSDSESVNELPVVQLSEDAELLNSLVSMLYPVRVVKPKSYDKVLHLLAACQKYDMVQVQSSIRERVKWRDFPAPGGTEHFSAYAIARSKGLVLEMEEAARRTLYYPMTFETLGEGLGLFKGSALRDLAQFRKRCRDNVVTRLESYLDVHAPGPSSIWLGCPDVTPKRSPSDSSPQDVFPGWLCQLIARLNNNLKLRGFTNSLDSSSMSVFQEYSTALRSHGSCKFCSGVDMAKGSIFWLGLWDEFGQAYNEVRGYLCQWPNNLLER